MFNFISNFIHSAVEQRFSRRNLVGPGAEFYVWDAQIKIYSPSLAKRVSEIREMLLIEIFRMHMAGSQLSLEAGGRL